jgi:predicted benzoate:H+ symporter BenE
MCKNPSLEPLTLRLKIFNSQSQFLAGFSAVKFSQHGPGALFVFANCGLDDLLASPEP